jgi:hypothetical protein
MTVWRMESGGRPEPEEAFGEGGRQRQREAATGQQLALPTLVGGLLSPAGNQLASEALRVLPMLARRPPTRLTQEHQKSPQGDDRQRVVPKAGRCFLVRKLGIEFPYKK